MRKFLRVLCMAIFLSLATVSIAFAETPPKTADEYYAEASQYGPNQPYDALSILSEAETFYPNDTRFETGINDRVKTILNWSAGSQKSGDYWSAMRGYQTVINAPAVYSYLRNGAVRENDLASKGEPPLTADQYNNMSCQYTYGQPYDALSIYSEGNTFYPNDNRFVNGINNRAETILEWSEGSQSISDFGSAIRGYYTILESPAESSIKDQAQRLLGFANQGKVYYSADQYYTMDTNLGYGQPYEALKLLEDANYLYPNDSRFIKEINYRASTILNWSEGSQAAGDFNAAIYGYNTVVGASSIEQDIRNEASALLIIAEKGILYNPDGRYVLNTAYSNTFSDFIDKQMTVNPQTDLYGGGWQSANRVDVEYYANPQNFTDADGMYQFLVLSGQAGVDSAELNNILQGKGVLQNQGSSFIEASLKYNINEIYLVSHALLETGNGTSQLATGVSYNGKVVYNVYGIGATDSDPINGGAQYAYNHGWFTIEDAIVGGAAFVSNNYIGAGQDTLYKMRWNPQNPATHQYASDIGWAVKQIDRIKSLYDLCKNCILRFDIPVFKTIY